VLSVGFAGCNLHCPFCQNWRISQLTPENRPPGFGTPRKTGIPGGKFSPEKLIASVRSGGFTQVAYTYSEPLVHAEFLLDCMTLAREAGIANVLVSNGCLNREPAEAILALTDAANIDLKCFSEDTYSRVLGGDLSSVLAFIETAWKTGVRLEVTTLIVPGLNDGEEETGRCAAFLAGLSRDIPWHLSAYHPDYRWRTPPTEPSRLIEIARRVRETLPYVYTGNIGGEKGFSDTPCPRCGVPLVRRNGYRIDTSALVLRQTEAGLRYHCARCGNPTPIIST
jgi:pyruvate formate lyase activating enzyme